MVALTAMSYPEGPLEGEQAVDQSRDAADSAPTDGLVATLTRTLRRHFGTWGRRYVEMRVDAQTGRRGR